MTLCDGVVGGGDDMMMYTYVYYVLCTMYYICIYMYY